MTPPAYLQRIPDDLLRRPAEPGAARHRANRLRSYCDAHAIRPSFADLHAETHRRGLTPTAWEDLPALWREQDARRPGKA